MTSLAIVVPMLDESKALPLLARALGGLDPPPAEIIAVDGGSSDASVALAEAAGWRVIGTSTGRGRQVNAGVKAAQSDLVCILHADTIPPPDMVAVIASVMEDESIALAGFAPIIRGPDKTRWGTTFHNWAKTWYAPLLFRPHLFVRGTRLLFGDHAMFFRRADFIAVGGCDEDTPVMEDADLCVRMTRRGKVRLIRRTVETSDRRVAEWGALRANWIYLKLGVLWALGARERLGRDYPEIR